MPEEQEQSGEELTFEKALSRLEGIVTKMEQGELTLDQMMVKFEEGMKLVTTCADNQNETEKKIEVLLKKTDTGGEWSEMPSTEPQDDETEDTDNEV